MRREKNVMCEGGKQVWGYRSVLATNPAEGSLLSPHFSLQRAVKTRPPTRCVLRAAPCAHPARILRGAALVGGSSSIPRGWGTPGPDGGRSAACRDRDRSPRGRAAALAAPAGGGGEQSGAGREGDGRGGHRPLRGPGSSPGEKQTPADVGGGGGQAAI